MYPKLQWNTTHLYSMDTERGRLQFTPVAPGGLEGKCMQGNALNGIRVAILSTTNFEQAELVEPKKALEQAGATVKIISPKPGTIQGMNHDVKADTFNVDMTLDQANPDDFDAVMLPGGALNAD